MHRNLIQEGREQGTCFKRKEASRMGGMGGLVFLVVAVNGAEKVQRSGGFSDMLFVVLSLLMVAFVAAISCRGGSRCNSTAKRHAKSDDDCDSISGASTIVAATDLRAPCGVSIA